MITVNTNLVLLASSKLIQCSMKAIHLFFFVFTFFKKVTNYNPKFEIMISLNDFQIQLKSKCSYLSSFNSYIEF